MEDRPIGVLCKKKALQNYKYLDKLSEQINNVPKQQIYCNQLENVQRQVKTQQL
jgi:hypothetical protein